MTYTSTIDKRKRTKEPYKKRLRIALLNPDLIIREFNNKSFYHFLTYFWDEISNDTLIDNWHIKLLCDELQIMAERVSRGERKAYDLLINIPPGTSKTTICMILFPVWCWTKWYWMRFICLSYAGALSLESAETSRDLVRSVKFQNMYPEIDIKQDKDTKSNFKIVKKEFVHSRQPRLLYGGNRYSTSVGGTLTGYHGHIILNDDPINPHQAASETELHNTNRWLQQTLPTRKVNKAVTPTITIMQRVHRNDPSGMLLEKKKAGTLKHICLPGEIVNYYQMLQPKSLAVHYVDGLLDSKRMTWEDLDDLEADLGQYGFSSQVGQNPVPPTGGMFKVNHFSIVQTMPAENYIEETVRYWDKAGTKEQYGLSHQSKGRKIAYTVGVKMHRLKTGKYLISDVVRGRWEAEERERIIKLTAEADGNYVKIYHEQEPGSGGKQSAQATNRNLDGFSAASDAPRGDKIFRADPFSVQVNNGNVQMLQGAWNSEFIEEHRDFPFSTYKDQVDAASGAYSKLSSKKRVKVI